MNKARARNKQRNGAFDDYIRSKTPAQRKAQLKRWKKQKAAAREAERQGTRDYMNRMSAARAWAESHKKSNGKFYAEKRVAK